MSIRRKPARLKQRILLRYAWHKRKQGHIETSLPLPKFVVFEPTMRCNLKCWFCYQEKSMDVMKHELAPEKLDMLFLHLPTTVKTILLIGGEVFVYPHIWYFLEQCRTRGINVEICTNATLISGDIRKNLLIFADVVTMLGGSIDGIQYHDSVRGNGALQKTIENLKSLKGHIKISTNTVVNKDNISEIRDTYTMIKDELNPASAKFQFMQYSSNNELKASEKIIGAPIVVNQLIGNYQREIDLNNVKALMQELGKRAAKDGIEIAFQPDFPGKKFDEFWLEKYSPQSYLSCHALSSARINYKGELNICPFMRNNFGSVLDQNFSEVWNSPKLIAWRANILKQRLLLPLCRRCCKIV